jgi:hypothetical protein
VNRYLKWAYLEAANIIASHQGCWPTRHGVRLYQRVKDRRGSKKALGAVARHLAEATYWILTKEVPYQEPRHQSRASTKA